MKTIKFENVQPVQQSARGFDLKYERIKSVYHGRIDACTCGCDGEYFYTKHYANHMAQVEGNKLLLPLANDNDVEWLLKDALTYSHKAEFFVQVDGGYCIKVPTYIDHNKYDEEVQMGYIINLHWGDLKLNQPVKILV